MAMGGINMNGETTVEYVDEIPDFYDEMSFDHIVQDPGILGGKPTIKGTRISVQIVLEWLASGATFDQIVADFPHLSKDDLVEAVYFAASKMGIPKSVPALVAA
jgi:uncharacterized protein (DUF433 family)